jgi:glutamate synthase (NADPH/NADH) large chain
MMQTTTTKGLYTPELEHDACGIGFIANINGTKSNNVLRDALTMLENMEHRGGKGHNAKTGDGAGVLIQIPHDFLAEEASRLGFELPACGKYGVGMVFFPRDKKVLNACREVLRKNIAALGLELIGFRGVPVDHSIPGPGAAEVEPVIEQVFVKSKNDELICEALERKLFVLRNYTSHRVSKEVKGNNKEFYITSFSSKTIVYKGQLRTEQLRKYFFDLQDPRLRTALALVHSRFSTNTFPNWKLAQPFRYIAHNGEINTIRGNVNKMKSKEAMFKSTLFTEEELKMLLPITVQDGSDSANLDAMVEMLVLSGRSIPHVMMMLVPEAWQDNKLMDPHRKAFYKYHASMMEPWDGPAALVFTDGMRIGATLDRNGLRPLRYYITRSGRIVMASEAGALPVDPKDVLEKGRITPGKMMLVDLDQGKVLDDEKVKRTVYEGKPYFNWIIQNRLKLRLEPEQEWFEDNFEEKTLGQRQNAYGFTDEDIRTIITPMAATGYEAIGSMGDDTPLAVLSKESRHISNYFKQHFAQVSNPPIDPIRERLVMSLFTRIGQSLNVLEETPQHTAQIHISQPVLLNNELEKLKHLPAYGYEYAIIRCAFLADGKPGRLEESLNKICLEAEKAIRAGKKVIVLSDKKISPEYAPIPSLLSIGAVHHYLVEKRIRTHAGLLVEAGDVWEVHHFATIIGYGASAINPYMALETIHSLNKSGYLGEGKSDDDLYHNYQKAVGNGLLKVMSKMGISTLQSYQSAQIFEALGLGSEVIDKCFRGTISRIEGLSFDDLAQEVLVRHRLAYQQESNTLQVGGVYQWKRRGEKHLFSPEVIHLLQHSTKTKNYSAFKKYTEKINDQTKDTFTIRGLFEFKKRNSVPLEEVESVEDIFKRFATGAMSFGSISHEAHST